MSVEESKLNFSCKLVQALIKEDKKINDSMVYTKFVGEGIEGLFSKYSKDLEQLVFTNRVWEGVKTGLQMGEWVMEIYETNSGGKVAEVKKCRIKDITVKVGKEDAKIVTIEMQHQKSNDQSAIEAAVSMKVLLDLKVDTDMLEMPEPAE